MRAVIQRVSRAAVDVEGKEKAKIGNGFVVLLGAEGGDTEQDASWLAGKIARLRVFPDEKGSMNRSLKEVDGDVIVVSQFTLFASTKKGNRPSFLRAAQPEEAIPVYEKFLELLENELGKRVGTGEFGAHMQIDLVNDGPVTVWIDTRQKE